MKHFVSAALASCVAALALAAGAQAADLKKVGVSVVDLGNPFFGAIAGSVDAAVKKAGGPDAETLVVSGDYDLTKQSSQIDNFIQAGVDLIIVSAVDSRAIGAAIKRAEAAGVPVVAVDNTADGAKATVTTDNVEAGRQACGYIAEKLNGKGNVLIVNGPPVSGVIDRVKGCKEVFAGHEGIKILSDNQNGIGTREGGLNVTTGLLTAHDDVNAIFTINDPSAIGADLAAKQLVRTGIVITTVDGSPDVEASLKGNTMIEASSAQLPSELADAAVQAGMKLVSGETLETPDVLVAPRLITRETVGDYVGWNGKK
ncbi:ABC transporter substrate-binding protein [Aureimonas sp. ME7]|uniref:ABC transporter substrate-binding protein n=1 Tax=Aureimonas sp. ME7 TaxID=2744252 RepID=UPI0015FC0C78|nr:ABC transporter substrate-binding protein [Aureimonas sp. ME7]